MTEERRLTLLPDDELSKTVRSKVVQLRQLDKKLDGKKSKASECADLFASQCVAQRLPRFAREFEFASEINRRWKFDFAFALKKPSGRMFRLAVEIEGIVMRQVNGQWQMGGRHATISGFKEDCIKYCTATLLGWHVVRFEQSQIASGFAWKMVLRILVRNGYRVPA